MKYPDRYIDMQAFIDFAWQCDPKAASRMSAWWDMFRRATKQKTQAASLNAVQGSTTFTVDGRYRVQLRGTNDMMAGLFLTESYNDGALCWSSTEMDLVLEMTRHSVAMKNITTSEDFMDEYARLLVAFRTAFQAATQENDA